MKRIREIISDSRNRYPNDDFFFDFEETYRISELKRKTYQAYGRVLNKLDDQSWQVLKEKALRDYKNHRKGQKKQGFFNQLNEAFAYSYLIKQGCNKINFLEEDGTKKPDLEYIYKNVKGYCEVKTLGLSKVEIEWRGSQIDNVQKAPDSVPDYILDGRFFEKYRKVIDEAWDQIYAIGQRGMVYIIIIFDDSTLDSYHIYRKQLINYSRQQKLCDVFLKVGLLGNKRIGVFHKFHERIG